MIMPMLKISHSLAPFEDLAEFGNFPSGSPLPRKILSSPPGLPSWSMSFSTRIPCVYIYMYTGLPFGGFLDLPLGSVWFWVLVKPFYLLVFFFIYHWVVFGFTFG